MLFNSIQFAVFFPVVTAVYFALPNRYRVPFLAVASYIFYMAWVPSYVFLLLFSTFVSYGAARVIENSKSVGMRRTMFVAGLGVNLGILFLFKYFNFFNDSLQWLFSLFSLPYHTPDWRLLLPVGISFYTFQTVGYVVDVYRGQVPAERNPWLFALYVSFFPQLVAGPIERAGSLMPQLRAHHDLDYQLATDGMKLMAWGLFKKVVVADRLGSIVAVVYANPENYTGPALAIATIMAAWQIYCDFSGYSDIAIGAAQIMGIRLMNNFERPFFARSLPELWRRWHISLTTWFRDYLFFPMGGSRGGALNTMRNVVVVFAICGLWHGANWTFVLWGTFTGVLLCASMVTQPLRRAVTARLGFNRIPRIHAAMQTLITFGLFSIVGILFRAQNIQDAAAIYSRLFTGWLDPYQGGSFRDFVYTLGLTKVETFWLAVGVLAILIGVEAVQERGPIAPRIQRYPVWARWCMYYAFILLVICLGVFDESPFVYFQF